MQLNRFENRQQISQGSVPCKIVIFRSKRKLQQFVVTLRACRAAEQQFLNVNKIVSNWWGVDNKLIFSEPSLIGFFESPYAKLYFAKFEMEHNLVPYTKAYSDPGLETFFDALYPFLYNRYPARLPCNPRFFSHFNFNLQKISFCPGNSRHPIRLRGNWGQDKFIFQNV